MITLTYELDREDDGRWIAEVLELPGVLAYGDSPGRGDQGGPCAGPSSASRPGRARR